MRKLWLCSLSRVSGDLLALLTIYWFGLLSNNCCLSSQNKFGFPTELERKEKEKAEADEERKRVEEEKQRIAEEKRITEMEVQAKQEELARLAEVAEKESHEKDELVTVILKF